MKICGKWSVLLVMPSLFAQSAQHVAAKAPFQAASRSEIDYRVDKDQSEVVSIANVAYEMAGPGIPGRPPDGRMILRKTSRIKHVVGDIGMEASSTIEAWPLGVNVNQPPLYSVTVDG